MAENIFVFLGYKDTKADDKTVLDKLKSEKVKWINQKSRAPERANAKLAVIAALEAELAANPNMIGEHRRLFDEIKKAERKAQEKALRDDAQIFVVNGEIEETQLNALQKKNPLFTTDEILQILGARIKAKRKPKPVVQEKGKLIDDFLYKSIQAELAKISKTDLYDFLGLKKTATAAQIKERNDQIYTDLMQGSKSREGFDAIRVLTGMVSTWLYTDDKRADYDRTLSSESFQSVARKIDQLAMAGNIIQPSQYKVLVEECTKKGMPLEKAEALIYEHAEKKGLTIVDGGLSDTTATCRFCGSINAKNAAICTGCGMPMKVTCPKCGHVSASSDETHCPKCGFNIGDMDKALACLKECEIKMGMNNIDGAYQSYLDASRYWPGYKGLAEMKSKIESTAPPAPSNLTVKLAGNIANLEWTAAQTRHIQYEYVVVRKAGSSPNSLSDGEQRGITRDNKISDEIKDSGVNYFYAVYARNGRSVSAQAAKSTQPVMVVADLKPSDINLDVKESQIGFNFKKTHAAAIEIYRDGQKLTTITGNTYIDSGLRTGQPYAYKFVAIYNDNTGKPHSSSGLPMTITPVALPDQVDLQLTEHENEAQISWKKPANGSLVIFQDDKPFQILAGNKVSLDALRFEQLEVAGTSVRILKNWSGIRYYLPVTVQGNIGVAGKPVSITSIGMVEGVSFDLEERRVAVKWRWKNCTAVRITYVLDGNIKKDVDIDKASSPAAEYKISIPDGSKSISVSVLAIVKTDKDVIVGRPVSESFNLKPAKVEFLGVENLKKLFVLGSNDYEIKFRTDSALPCDLHILVSENVPPTNLVNYSPAAVIRAADAPTGRENSVRLSYARRSKKAPLYFRMIASNRSMAKLVRIISEVQQIK